MHRGRSKNTKGNKLKSPKLISPDFLLFKNSDREFTVIDRQYRWGKRTIIKEKVIKKCREKVLRFFADLHIDYQISETHFS